jgi:hypothetical protein
MKKLLNSRKIKQYNKGKIAWLSGEKYIHGHTDVKSEHDCVVEIQHISHNIKVLKVRRYRGK